jgi:hypothetical protein
MSIKSDRSDTKSHHTSVPVKDDIAIVPPKKVRRLPGQTGQTGQTDH